MVQHLCARCVRQSLRWRTSFSAVQEMRSLSSSAISQAAVDLSRLTSKTQTATQPQVTETRSKFGAFLDHAQQKQAQNPRVLQRSGPARQSSSPAGRGPPRQGPMSQGSRDRLSKSGPPAGGQLLRRRSPSQGSPQSTGGARGTRPPQNNRDKRNRRPQRPRDPDDDGPEDPEEITRLEEEIYGPTGLAKEHIPYHPREPTLEDLRSDWPNTPLSTLGLTESVQQKIEVLADRIPHGYKAPDQLAERHHKGELMYFESAAEKEKVVRLAGELAKQRADKLTERKGEQIAVEDMSFADIGAEEKKELGIKMVKGQYPDIQKQRIPFLDTVMRNLRNNHTYRGSDEQQFLKKIETVLPKNAGKASPQVQKSA